MIDFQAAVTEFHRLYGLPVGDQTAPAMLSPERRELREDLIQEEADEIFLAGDLPNLAQELADIIYVAVGYAVELGIDIGAVFQEVHFSNMSKLDDNGLPVFRPDGKVMKTDNYFPPDVASVIAQQGALPRIREIR